VSDSRFTTFPFRRKLITNDKDLIFNKPLDEDVKTAAFMTSLTDVIYRNEQNYKDFVLKVCKEQLMTVNIVMYFPKNSYLREAFNRKLSDLMTSGIVQYWINKFADPKFLNINMAQNAPKRLRVEQLSGVLNVWLIGCAVGFLAFLIEIFSATIKKALRLK
jgi:hypothetical protein